MKKTLILLLLLSFGTWVKAQTSIWKEDFEGGVAIEQAKSINPDGGWQSLNLEDDTDGWRTGTLTDINSGGGVILEQLGIRFFGKEDSDKFLATYDDACKSNAGGQNPSCNKARETVVSPAVQLPEGKVFMAYDAFFAGIRYNDGTAETCSLVVTTNDGQSWTALAVVPTTYWGRVHVDLSNYAGKKVRIGFRYEDKNRAMFGAGVDNIEIFAPKTIDPVTWAAGSVANVQIGESFSVAARIFNRGSEPIREMTVRWRTPEGIWVSDVKTGLNIRPLTAEVVTHSINAVLSIPGPNLMNFGVTSANGDSNIEPSEVEKEWTVNALRSSTIRRPVLEEYTGAWCGWCPRGHNWFKCVLEKNPDVVGIAIHYGNQQQPDNMVIPEGLGVIQELQIGGFPNMTLDRAVLPGEQDFTLTTTQGYASIQNSINLRKAMPTPAHVRIIDRKYNEATREVEATVEAIFHSAVDIPAKLNLIITEDEVVGTGTGYDQANYMNATRSGNEFRTPCNNNSTTNPFYNKGEYMKGYKHDHVLRAMVGGVRGEGDFVPEAGKTYTQTFRYTLDEGWKTDKIHLVGTVQGGDPEFVVRRDIWNADQVSLLDDFMDAGPGFATSCKESVTLNPYMNFNADGATFSWQPTTGLSDSKVAKPTANPTQTTTYTLTVTNKDGKTFTDSVRVRVLPMVSFLPSSNYAYVGQEFQFLNVTTELNSYAYSWDFADAGATSTDIHGKHTYNKMGKYKVKLTATKNGDPCGETFEREIVVVGVSREDNAVYTDVNVYPNPTQGTLYLRSGINRNLTVRVLNLQGQEMLRTVAPANAQNFEVSLDDLAGGIYLLHITDGNNVRTEKIVKQD